MGKTILKKTCVYLGLKGRMLKISTLKFFLFVPKTLSELVPACRKASDADRFSGSGETCQRLEDLTASKTDRN
jgi:hypothetical protein